MSLIPTKQVGDAIIYGDSAKENQHEFLVFYHPNGLHADVFEPKGYEWDWAGFGWTGSGLSSKAVEEAITTSEDACEALAKIKQLK